MPPRLPFALAEQPDSNFRVPELSSSQKLLAVQFPPLLIVPCIAAGSAMVHELPAAELTMKK
jgi:hypothetical protein